ncbi:hypothetical protein [Cellulomonas sp. URHE0023]|uniref:hypothetical protein n=1 Tax=Cellulomonas sp. URHE0023 TaxID=1380354 RepID=UPI00068E6705|nr:hypothetical protein [Cellulomonas sp. URHE0023]
MRWSAGRLALLGFGVALVGVGAVVGLTSIPQRQWPGIVLWMAGGVAVHDAVLAPIAVLLGLVVLPRVRPAWRPALRAGALGAGVLAIFAVVIVGASSRRRNDSVVPVAPTTSLALAGAALLLAVLVGAVVGSLAPRRPAEPDPDLLPRETD